MKLAATGNEHCVREISSQFIDEGLSKPISRDSGMALPFRDSMSL